MKGDGECPNLRLAALRSPDLVSPRLDTPYPRKNSRRDQEPQQISGIFWNEPSPPTYGSGNKQDFENFDMMFPDETDTGSSSSAYSNTEGPKSNTNKDRPSRTNTNYHAEEATTLEAELLQLHYAERDLQSKSDNAESATPSWQFTTQRTHHRHRHHHTSRHTSHHTSHHTSLQTQSTEQLQPLHIRQVRSSTTKSK